MTGFITLKEGTTPEELVEDLVKQIHSRLALIIIQVPQDQEDEYEKTKYSIYKSLKAALEIPNVNQALSSLINTRDILLEWEKAFFVQDKDACCRLVADMAECLEHVYNIKYML